MMALKHVLAILLLPVTMTVIVPIIIIASTGAVHIGWALPTPFNLVPSLIGLVLISLGLILLVETVSLFATIGQGTLAPWNPTQKLVVRGVYRHVRNPMISGVFGILLGEATLLGSLALLGWSIAFALVNSVYIPLIEEPGLEQRFGADYVRYKQNVPRWIPRRTPWSMP